MVAKIPGSRLLDPERQNNPAWFIRVVETHQTGQHLESVESHSTDSHALHNMESDIIMSTETEPRIYVADLASYNNGVLHGVWINASDDASEMQEQVYAMLMASKFPNVEVECPVCEATDDECTTCRGTGKVPSAEEWAIHDFQGFGDILSEHTDLETIAKHAEKIAEHGEAWLSYCDHLGSDYALGSDFDDAYCGNWASELEFAESLIVDCYDLDEIMGSLSCYFDYESFARDLFISDYYFDEQSGHVFRRM